MRKRRNTAEQMDLNHVHLHVRNLDRATQFYESYFQFRRHMRHGKISFLRNGSGFDLSLVPDRKSPSFPEWFHFGFRLGTPRGVRELHRRMTSQGVRVCEIEDYGNYVTFRCLDPDAYRIEIYWSAS